MDKKRGTGIPTLKELFVLHQKDKDYLLKVLKKLDSDKTNLKNRIDICLEIKNRLLYYEKYSTKKDKKHIL